MLEVSKQTHHMIKLKTNTDPKEIQCANVLSRKRVGEENGSSEIQFDRGANMSENKFMKSVSSMIFKFHVLKKSLEVASPNYREYKLTVLGIDSITVHKNQVKLTIEKRPKDAATLSRGLYSIDRNVSKFLREKLEYKEDLFIGILGPEPLTTEEIKKIFLNVSKQEICMDIFGLIDRLLQPFKPRIIEDDSDSVSIFAELFRTTESTVIKKEVMGSAAFLQESQMLTASQANVQLKETHKNDQKQNLQAFQTSIRKDSLEIGLGETSLQRGTSKNKVTNIEIGDLPSNQEGFAQSNVANMSGGKKSEIKILSSSKNLEESKNPKDPVPMPLTESRLLTKTQIKGPRGDIIFDGQQNENYEREGEGIYIYPNGDRYEGSWKYDKRHGEGKMYYKLGSAHELAGGYYEGTFVDDKIEGIGKTINRHNVLIYEGSFKNNLRHGWGFLRDEGGDYYLGEFSNGFKHGNGTLFVRNGPAYDGNWYCNKKHGEFRVYPKWELDTNGKPDISKSGKGSIENFVYDRPGTMKKQKITIISDSNPKNANKSTEITLKQDQEAAPIQEIKNRFGIKITTEDMLTLEDKNPLGANIMNFYMRAVEAKSNELIYESMNGNNANIPRILFLDSDFFSELTKDTLDSKNTYYERVEMLFKAYSSPGHLIFNEFDKILIIVNKRGQHWVLAEILCEKERKKLKKISFRIYDSIPRDMKEFNLMDDDVTRHLLSFAIKEAEKIAKERPEESENILKLLKAAKGSYPKVPYQKDFFNCGVFVCKYLQYLALGRELSFDVLNISKFRKEIRNIILEVYHNPLVIGRKPVENTKEIKI